MTGSVEMVKARKNGTSPTVASTNDESLAEGRSEVGFMATETKTLPEMRDPEGADEGTEVKRDVDQANGVEKLENDFPLKSDQSQTITPKVGKARRGRARGTGNTGRGKRGGGALLHSRSTRSSQKFPCSYDADMARNGIEGLYNNYLSAVASNDKALEKTSFMIVTVRDIKPLVTEEDQLVLKEFSASKVESSLKEANPSEDSVIPELDQESGNSDDLAEVINSKKIVTRSAKLPLEEIMTDLGRSKRKLPSRSVDSEEEKPQTAKRPLWRQLRVDDDVIKRIFSRVFKGRSWHLWSRNDQVKNTNDNEDNASDVGSDKAELIPGGSSPNHDTDVVERKSTDDDNDSNQNPKKRTKLEDDLRSGKESDDHMEDREQL